MTDYFLPRLDELQPTPESVLLARGQGAELMHLLGRLQLSPMSDRHGNVWIMLLASGVHEHDRWFFYVPQVVGNDDWQDLSFDILLGCEHEHLTAQDIMAELRILLSTLEGFLPQSADPAGSHHGELGLKYLQAFQRFAWISPRHMRQVIGAAWGEELHDIMEHHELWSARQPTPMPRDLALRLYGMAPYVEALQEGRDWRDS